MSRRTRFQTYTWKERALSLLLAAVLLLGMAPGLTASWPCPRIKERRTTYVP